MEFCRIADKPDAALSLDSGRLPGLIESVNGAPQLHSIRTA
jgi:hypothetical protein